MITTGISSHVRYLLEERGVRCRAKTSIKTSTRWSVSFYLSSKGNRKFKHLVQTKPMGEIIITNRNEIIRSWY